MENALLMDRLLRTETAADLMTHDPLSLREDATLKEAVDFLTDKGISAAPVIDAGGRPVGVLSRADIVCYDRERKHPAEEVPDYYFPKEPAAWCGYSARNGNAEQDKVRVRDLMTPAIFSVTPDTPVTRVIADMTALNVHRLFVVDKSGILTGVISALDVLRHIHRMSEV